jgi:excisionase family DNA binding protein
MATAGKSQNPSGQALLDWAEVAERLGISTRHVRRLVYDPAAGVRRLPSIKVGGVIRFDPAAVDQWLAEQTVEDR